MGTYIIVLIAGICIGVWAQYLSERCKHTWKVLEKVQVSSDMGSSWTRYHLQCEKCGTPKSKNMR